VIASFHPVHKNQPFNSTNVFRPVLIRFSQAPPPQAPPPPFIAIPTAFTSPQTKLASCTPRELFPSISIQCKGQRPPHRSNEVAQTPRQLLQRGTSDTAVGVYACLPSSVFCVRAGARRGFFAQSTAQERSGGNYAWSSWIGSGCLALHGFNRRVQSSGRCRHTP